MKTILSLVVIVGVQSLLTVSGEDTEKEVAARQIMGRIIGGSKQRGILPKGTGVAPEVGQGLIIDWSKNGGEIPTEGAGQCQQEEALCKAMQYWFPELKCGFSQINGQQTCQYGLAAAEVGQELIIEWIKDLWFPEEGAVGGVLKEAAGPKGHPAPSGANA